MFFSVALVLAALILLDIPFGRFLPVQSHQSQVSRQVGEGKDLLKKVKPTDYTHVSQGLAIINFTIQLNLDENNIYF